MSMNPVVHFEMPYEDRDRMAGFYEKAFGWQALPRLLNDPDTEKAGRVMQAMLQMKKIDIKGLEKACGQK